MLLILFFQNNSFHQKSREYRKVLLQLEMHLRTLNNMRIPGIKPGLIISFTMILTAVFTEINAESSGGFRGKLVEKIEKSRHRMIHTIELKSVVQAQVRFQLR